MVIRAWSPRHSEVEQINTFLTLAKGVNGGVTDLCETISSLERKYLYFYSYLGIFSSEFAIW